MLSDWELWACANKMIEEHGLDAPIRAAMRADQFMKEGDLDGASTWRAIVRRISDLLVKPDGAVH